MLSSHVSFSLLLFTSTLPAPFTPTSRRRK
jgi:hypothetical protein